MKYVDDINLVVRMLSMGTRWVEDQFVTKEEWRLEDLEAGRSRQDVTIEAIRMAADSILPDLEFTADIPERHESNTVPMLDIQVWVQHPGPGSSMGVGHPLLDLLREGDSLSQGPQGELGILVEEQAGHPRAWSALEE